LTLGTLDGNRLADFDAENTRLTMGETLVEGSCGAIRIDGRARIFVRHRGKAEREHEYVWSRSGYAGDSVHALQAHVVDHLRQGTPLENAGADYLNAVRVEEAAYQSHQEERWINIQHPRRAA
jgi:predicted dehydrogenase